MTGPGLHLYLAMNPTGQRNPANWAPLVGDQPIKWLCSYHYFKRHDMDEMVARFNPRPQLFADSGAFSAFTSGAEVKVDDYAAWLKRWEHLFEVYVNLDVIRDPKATAANQRRLESHGLNPIPVFHTGSPWPVLDGLAQSYPYIALGGMVGTRTTEVLRWAATAFKRVEDTGTQFHGFGQTRDELLVGLPWYSVDSSTWANATRFGQVFVWADGLRTPVYVGRPITDHKKRQALRAIGIDPAEITDRSRFNSDVAVRAGSLAYRHLELALRRRHGPIHLPTPERNHP